MTIDYRDNMPSEIKEQLPTSAILDTLNDAVKGLVKLRAIKSPRHNVNIYMPLSIVDEFRKLYRRSLSKRNRERYAKMLSKNIVVIGGHRLRIRTKYKGYDLQFSGGTGDIYVVPM